MTNETDIKQKLCHDKGSSVTTLIIAAWKSLLKHKNIFRERHLSRQGNVCRNTKKRRICHNKVMYVMTLKEEETLVAIDKQGRDM